MPNSPSPFSSARFSRRRFLKTTGQGLGVAALLANLPKGWAGAVTPATGPETPKIKIGMIALTDCAPFVIAFEKGFFQKYGIEATIAKQASWAAVRDNFSSGDLQATHMLLGMPFASTMGLLGSPKKPMIIPWLLNRNGQAITLKNAFKGKVGADPKALKPLVDEAKKAGNPLTFAMTFPPGTHAMWTRYFLAAGGINPDKDVNLITVPPPQMIANMQVGKMDGFCVGEPWGARAIEGKIGYTAITTQEIWKDHPEKVFAFTAEFADKNPRTVKACLQALQEASVWLDDMENRPEACKIIDAPTYINCPAETILSRMQGHIDYGDSRGVKEERTYYMTFHDRDCNYPQPKFGKWWLSQFRRWGMVTGAPDYEGLAATVMRPDLYEEAMKEISVKPAVRDDSPVTLFDGVTFDPKDPEKYATSFAVHSLKNS